MTVTPALREYLTKLPGRCPDCVWHVPSMGHAPACTQGVTLGAAGMAKVTANHPNDAARIDAVIESYARTGLEFSLNDLRPHLTQVKARNTIGARVNAAIRRKRITEVGRVRSNDPATHGHRIGVYRGT